MKLLLQFKFCTDGDFHIKDYNNLINPKDTMYKNANIKYLADKGIETIWIGLLADGERNACRWAARDLMERLVCSVRTHKYYLIKELYDMIIPAKEDLLWSNSNVSHYKGLSGNYDGTFIRLNIEEDGKSTNENIVTAVKKYLGSKQKANEDYPFMVKTPTDEQIEQIAAMCLSDDMEEIHEMCGRVLGIALPLY